MLKERQEYGYGRCTCKSKYQTDTNAMPIVTNMSTFTNTLIDTMSRRWITRTAAQCQYRSLL